MRAIPAAIGYIHRDVSGVRQPWDETRIRSLAKRLGYNLMKTVVFSARTVNPAERLVNVARHLDIDAVIVPSLDHLDGDPEPLVLVCDVITISPENTYARWSVPPILRSDGMY